MGDACRKEDNFMLCHYSIINNQSFLDVSMIWSSIFSKWKQVFLPLNIFSNYFGVVSATLLVAINEIRRSARAKGLSFYQYGMCRYSNKVCGYLKQNLFTSVCITREAILSVFPFLLLYWSVFYSSNKYILQIRWKPVQKQYFDTFTKLLGFFMLNAP